MGKEAKYVVRLTDSSEIPAGTNQLPCLGKKRGARKDRHVGIGKRTNAQGNSAAPVRAFFEMNTAAELGRSRTEAEHDSLGRWKRHLIAILAHERMASNRLIRHGDTTERQSF